MVKTVASAQRLTSQLVPYMLDSHVQVFAQSPFFRKIEPSPTEALSYNVAAALLSLGTRHADVQETIAAKITIFLNACKAATNRIVPSQGEGGDGNVDDAVRTATIAVALLGFLDAASAQADFWRSGSRLALVQLLGQTLSEEFLVTVETAFSTIRNTHSQDRLVREWKRYMRHYSEIGRPLGAMLLRRSYMWLSVAATSLLVADIESLRSSHILDVLLSGNGLLRPMTARSGDADFLSVEVYANVVIEQMNYLEASADYDRLGSSAKQRLAFGTKAAALISYLNCSKLNESVADADVLMNWLEDTLADPVQMADEDLASVVLRCMALICRILSSFAPNVSRILPRFIVQSGARPQIIETASKCLAMVLQMLSNDAVITTLYTLGNVLSPGNEGTLTNGTNGDASHETMVSPVYGGLHSAGSSISLQISGEEDTSAVHCNVVQAICSIASACKDEKIAALAQSVLLQKLNKVNGTVDARILTGAATLALTGGQLEFRSLLKLYARICHIGITENKEILLSAVGVTFVVEFAIY